MKVTERILDVYFVTTENYTVRKEQINGVEYMVVPVTMMTEGVRSGSHGPIMHLAEELGKYPESWDGITATISHPILNGNYVSANSPQILQDWAVGRIFNTHIDGTALKAEAWLIESDLERISEPTINRINDGALIEVSIGIFSDEEKTSGIWNGIMYNAIARNYRPNHLALLPDEVGACSIVDGCGIRVNKKGETKVENEKLEIESNTQPEVAQRLIPKTNKDTGCTECVKKLVDNLIVNKTTAWNEKDREYLESQPEEQLEKMTPAEVVEVKTNAVKPTRAEILAVFSEQPMTNEEFLGLASPEVRSQIEEGLTLRTNQKAELVSQIAANTENWTEDELNAKPVEELQKIYKLVNVETGTVYTGVGGLGGKTQIQSNKKQPKVAAMLPMGVQ